MVAHQAQWTNLQIAQAFGPSNLVNKVVAESVRGCNGCNALAVNIQIDLVSYASYPPNETNTATAIDQGGTGDTNLAAAAQFVVDAPGRVSLSGSGWWQLESINWQLRSLSLKASGGPAVQAQINSPPRRGSRDPRDRRHRHDAHVTPAPTPAVSPAAARLPSAQLWRRSPLLPLAGFRSPANIQVNT